MQDGGKPGQKRGLREMSRREEQGKGNRMRQQQEQQRLRQEYQKLNEEVKDAQSKDELGLGKLHFETFLDKSDHMSAQAARPREQLQDADVLETLSFQLKMEVRKLQQHEGRSPADFVAALCRMYNRGGPAGMGGEGEGDEQDEGPSEHSFDWARHGREHALEIFRPATTFGTMLGPLSAEAPKARAAPQRRRQGEPAGEAVAPQEMDADTDAAQNDQERERETEARVRSLFKSIKKARPGSNGVPVLPLLVDPDSFTKSVENVFALSFLIKEGRCQLNAIPGAPGASPMECLLAEPKTAPTEAERAENENTQFILRMDYADWKKLSDLRKQSQ